MVTPLPEWSAYLILTAIGGLTIGLMVLVRRIRGRSRDVSVWPRGRSARRLPPH
jgi:hypothetical protein